MDTNIKITNTTVYNDILSMLPHLDEKIHKKMVQRIKVCSGCINFMKLALACGKCGCQKQTEYVRDRGKFVKEKLFDLSYHCEIGYW